jgi:hypothetical protein
LLVFFVQDVADRPANTGCDWIRIEHRRFSDDTPMLEGLAASYPSDLFLLIGSGQVSLERICAQELRFRDGNRSTRKMEEDGGML